MAQPSGTRTVTCWICGERYRLTNWMRRRHETLNRNGKRLTNTHEIACDKKQPAQRKEPNENE